MSKTHKLGAAVALSAIVAAIIIFTSRGSSPHRDQTPGPGASKQQRPESGSKAFAPTAAGGERRPDAASPPDPPAPFPSELARVLESQPERLERLQAAFNRWHRTQPELAVKLTGILAERFGIPAEEGVDPDWTQAEAHRAMGLVLELKEVEDRLPLLSALASLLATVDPIAALQYVDSFENLAEKEQFVGEVLDGWTETDPDGAVEWARAEPSGPHREMMLERIVQNIVQEQPAVAAALVAADFESPEVQANAVRTVVGRWVHTDAPAAGEWLALFPETGLRSDMLKLLIASWRSRDEKAADAWVQALPAGKFRSQAESIAADLKDATPPLR